MVAGVRPNGASVSGVSNVVQSYERVLKLAQFRQRHRVHEPAIEILLARALDALHFGFAPLTLNPIGLSFSHAG